MSWDKGKISTFFKGSFAKQNGNYSNTEKQVVKSSLIQLEKEHQSLLQARKLSGLSESDFVRMNI